MPSNGFLIKALLVHDMLKTKKYIYSYLFNDIQCWLLQVVELVCTLCQNRVHRSAVPSAHRYLYHIFSTSVDISRVLSTTQEALIASEILGFWGTPAPRSLSTLL